MYRFPWDRKEGKHPTRSKLRSFLRKQGKMKQPRRRCCTEAAHEDGSWVWPDRVEEEKRGRGLCIGSLLLPNHQNQAGRRDAIQAKMEGRTAGSRAVTHGTAHFTPIRVNYNSNSNCLLIHSLLYPRSPPLFRSSPKKKQLATPPCQPPSLSKCKLRAKS